MESVSAEKATSMESKLEERGPSRSSFGVREGFFLLWGGLLLSPAVSPPSYRACPRIAGSGKDGPRRGRERPIHRELPSRDEGCFRFKFLFQERCEKGSLSLEVLLYERFSRSCLVKGREGSIP